MRDFVRVYVCLDACTYALIHTYNYVTFKRTLRYTIHTTPPKCPATNARATNRRVAFPAERSGHAAAKSLRRKDVFPCSARGEDQDRSRLSNAGKGTPHSPSACVISVLCRSLILTRLRYMVPVRTFDEVVWG